jgi:hypothetical protein
MTHHRRRLIISMAGLSLVALVVSLWLVNVGDQRVPAGLSCSTQRPVAAAPSASVPLPSGAVEPTPPSTLSAYMQVVVLSNDGRANVTVSCGRRSSRRLAPGESARFSANEDVPVVLRDAHGRHCFWAGFRAPGGLGEAQPDGSQAIHTSEAGPC